MKKGFTLIELLAVLTILAIILLIAIPMLGNVIKNSREKANEDSVNLYGRAIENAINEYYAKYPLKNEVTLKELEDENLIKYKGNKVECNTVRIIDREVYLADCKVGNKNVDITYGEIFGKLIDDSDADGKVSVGDKYSCRVNNKDKFNFYVLSLNDDDTVNLIMDRNICEDGTTNYTEQNNYCRVASYDAGLESNGGYKIDKSKGPITALQYLYRATKNWSNVPNANIEFINNKYNPDEYLPLKKEFRNIKIKDGVGVITDFDGNEIKINLENKTIKSRLMLKSDLIQFDESIGSQAYYTLPEWLVENLHYYDKNINTIPYGDVNSDNEVTDDDSLIIRKLIAYNSEVTFDRQLLKIADVDLDGTIDLKDVTCIANRENSNVPFTCIYQQYPINEENKNMSIYGYWYIPFGTVNFQTSDSSAALSNDSYAGVRPVITVPINYLAN